VPLKRQQELKAEVKLLTAIYADEVFHGRTVCQAIPSCCGKEIDLFAADIAFREINLGKKVFHLLEPTCPDCKKRHTAIYALLS
jgi:hypothetical protein